MERLRGLTSRRWSVSMERRIDEINCLIVTGTTCYWLADTSTRLHFGELLGRRIPQVR
jgi:hypothetical protein